MRTLLFGLLLLAMPALAESDSILPSLPSEVQKGIEDLRASCREYLAYAQVYA
jgi:hypothetical protein